MWLNNTNIELNGTLLDGELVGPKHERVYYAFDILFFRDKDVRGSLFWKQDDPQTIAKPS